ncbi:MAG TPA: hypothetical protein VG079_07110 [Gaiellaceae bacterium]|nr:hypothetical protein [Gaiellaceae bacterium]
MTITAATTATGLDGIASLHAGDMPQKDSLCGCFWGSLVLRAVGIESPDGGALDQDRVAAEAGTILPDADPARLVPPGEPPRRDYRLPLPKAADPSLGGTAAPALARALETLAGGRLTVVPVAGPWDERSLVVLVEAAASTAPETTLLANIRTGRLWPARGHPAALLDYLAGRDAAAEAHEWDVGHFVNVAAAVRGGERALIVVRDSYRSLGWEGHHLQPAHALAGALARGDGREGGVLCVAAVADAPALRDRLAADGFDIRHWDNGTPDPG